jgi:hypothetical protein
MQFFLTGQDAGVDLAREYEMPKKMAGLVLGG